MEQEVFGVKVTAKMADGSIVTLRNITEMHYRYSAGYRIAFESDIHSTGFTYALDSGTHPAVTVVEFYTTPETEIQEGV